jgi:hypothetical protein
LYTADDSIQDKESVSNPARLGPAGLSLHYANVVMQIDNLVSAIYVHHVKSHSAFCIHYSSKLVIISLTICNQDWLLCDIISHI